MNSPVRPPKTLLRAAGSAIVDFGMIHEGDRILLGLSGGKDSLSLLHVLLHLQRHAPIGFEIAAGTVDFQVPGSRMSSLKDYMSAFTVPYWFHSEPVAERARDQMRGNSFGPFGARLRRGMLYSIARREGYNVLALAQHLDDLAESFLMSVFRGGVLKTMKAHYLIDAADLRVIRPLVYARERQIADFARAAGLPVIPDAFPPGYEPGSERRRIKALLAEQEHAIPDLFSNLLRAMRPLMAAPVPGPRGRRTAATLE